MRTAGWPDPASLPTWRRHPVAPLGRHTRGGNDSHATPGGCSRRNPDGGAGRCRGRLRRGWPRRLRHRPQAGPDRVQQEHQAHEQHPARRPVRRPVRHRPRLPGRPGVRRQLPGLHHLRHLRAVGSGDARAGELPRFAERHQRARRPGVPVHRLLAVRRQLRERHASRSTTRLSWEGIKIFDVSDPTSPKYIKSVETKCGSHTHTVVPGDDADYLYVSSYGPSAASPPTASRRTT